MPYKFRDLTSGGRDLIITNKSQLAPQVTGTNNGKGYQAYSTTAPSQPGIYYADTAGFFAPVWGSGEEGITVVADFYMNTSATYDMLLTWAHPSNGGVTGWGLYPTNINKIEFNFMNNSLTGIYLGAATTNTISSGRHLIHAQARTGSSRGIRIWIDNVEQAMTGTAGSGVPYVPNGGEILQALSRPDGYGSVQRPVSYIGVYKRLLTNAERSKHLEAFNAA